MKVVTAVTLTDSSYITVSSDSSDSIDGSNNSDRSDSNDWEKFGKQKFGWRRRKNGGNFIEMTFFCEKYSY